MLRSVNAGAGVGGVHFLVIFLSPRPSFFFPHYLYHFRPVANMAASHNRIYLRDHALLRITSPRNHMIFLSPLFLLFSPMLPFFPTFLCFPLSPLKLLFNRQICSGYTVCLQESQQRTALRHRDLQDVWEHGTYPRTCMFQLPSESLCATACSRTLVLPSTE